MFKIGKIYKKQTESWCGNDPKGTKVIIISIEGNFVKFKILKHIFGSTFILNKWSFIRIFIDPTEIPLKFNKQG